MINSLYYDPVYFDAEWGLHHLVRHIVGAVYSGLVELARHFTKILDFILTPKNITIENIWTGYAAVATSITIPINVTNVSNAYVVAILTYNGSNTSGVLGATLNGVSMTNINRTYNAASIFGQAPATTGAQNVVIGTLGATKNICGVVFLCSGVNQTTPSLDNKNATATATSVANGALSADTTGLIIDCYSSESGTPGAASGQTTVSVSGNVCAGYLRPASTSVITSMNNSASAVLHIAGVSLNPA